MAGSINKAILIGTVGADPDIREMSGKKLANIRLATSETWRDKASGEKRERTEWHRVAIFNDNIVKLVEQYVKKGTKLYVEGQIQTRKWQDKTTGEDRYATEIVLQTFGGHLIFLESPRRGDSGDAPARSNGQQSAPKSYARKDDDIPF